MSSALAALKSLTKVVADSGDFKAIAQFKPCDATTNPSLLLAAVGQPQYEDLVKNAVLKVKTACSDKENLDQAVDTICDELITQFGCQILEVVPGVVSIEVDASLSFDTEGSVQRARHIVGLFKDRGVSKDRLLIKLAATWEGCRAARTLEAEGIHCNLTLMFSMCQAIAAAEAGATLISPFVGRILDWFKKNTGEEYTAENDPGVVSVKQIFNYYKKHGYKTIVMGASFRNVGEILALAGCDNLTISPKLLTELEKLPSENVTQQLNANAPQDVAGYEHKVDLTEKEFRWQLNEDQMATEKLAEGIRGFNRDWIKLKKLIREKYF